MSPGDQSTSGQAIGIWHQIPIKNIEVEVRAIGPAHGAEISICVDAREGDGIGERCEDLSEANDSAYVYDPFDPVFEAKM